MELYWNILDDKRLEILPILKTFSEDGFYLAGGTGLALQLGHRDSIDFDFFIEGDYDTKKLVEKIESVFIGHTIIITQEEKNTLSCVIDSRVQLSFFGFNYPLLKTLIKTDYFNIASIPDIACMKLMAITSRSVEKDYVDLYFILQKMSLQDVLSFAEKKYPSLDQNLILKSLVYFDDVMIEPILFKNGHDVSFETIKVFLKKLVTAYF